MLAQTRRASLIKPGRRAAKLADLCEMHAVSDASVAERVQALAPWINEQVQRFEDGLVKTGVRTFQAEIIQAIHQSGLLEVMYVDLAKVGTHPDNREGCMVVPIDVHDLLLRIVADGWDESIVDALACRIPPDMLADWRAKNKDLADNSCGLLPPCQTDLLEIVTARGSHTTSAARIVAFGADAVYPTFALDGKVSQRMILECQPSMAIPLEKGIKYQVLRHELVTACPSLMAFLSKTGNASHGVHRKQTMVQGLKRVHDLASAKMRAGDTVDWDSIAKLASLGMGTNYASKAQAYCRFVEAWAGGLNGALIADRGVCPLEGQLHFVGALVV